MIAESDGFGEIADILGGNTFIEGFDPPPGQNINPDEWDEGIDVWARSDGQSGTAPQGSWNTIPFGDPANCLEKLFVYISPQNSFAQIFSDTKQHLIKCQNTRTVVFYISGCTDSRGWPVGYLKWMDDLRQHLPRLKDEFRGVTFVTRIASSWMGRPCQKPQEWRGCIRQGETENGAAIPLEYISSNRASFKHRIWLLEELGLLTSHSGYIDLHTGRPLVDEPEGPTVSFGLLQGNRIRHAKARIYLSNAAPAFYLVGFNIDFALAMVRRHGTVSEGFVCWEKQFDNFLMEPYNFLDENKLPDRRH